jgi:hypothetical protein
MYCKKIIFCFALILIQVSAFSQEKFPAEKGDELIKDQGVIGSFHKKNIGKIIFSDQEIGINAQSGEYLKNDFSNLKSGIYGQVFLSQSLKNTRLSLGLENPYEKGFSVQYYVDGLLVYTTHNRRISVEQDEEWTSWQVIPAPSNKDEYNSKVTQAFAEVLMLIRPGKRHFKIVLLAINDPLERLEKIIAEGEFNLLFTDKDREDFVMRYKNKPLSIKQ